MLAQILTFINHEIRMAETGRNGLGCIVSLHTGAGRVQQQRGRVNGYPGGDPPFAPELVAKVAEIDKVLAEPARLVRELRRFKV